MVAGEAGEYDIVYSLPKEGRYIFTINIFHGKKSPPFVNHIIAVVQKENNAIFQVQDVDQSVWL